MPHINRKIRPLWHGFTYFPHQIDGIQWMLEKEINGTEVSNRNDAGERTIYGGFQCDDMGLGKTMQITSTIVNNPLKRTLLVAPLAMIDTWSQVLQRAGIATYEVDTKAENPWILKNDKASGIPKHFMKMRPGVYITNYEKLYTSPSIFRGSTKEPVEWDRIVLDEAHKIRNGDGEIARQARRIIAPVRWVVTGTPLVNSLKDIVSLFAFLGADYSPLWTWETRYIRALPDMVIHRSLASMRDIIPGAPPVPEISKVILPFASRKEKEFYLGIQGTDDALSKRYAADLLSPRQMFKMLLRLRQISVHPQVYINAKRREDKHYKRPDWNGQSTKLEEIKNIIETDNDKSEERKDGQPHKYLIFCQFNDEMELLKQYLEDDFVVDEVFTYNGSMTKGERDEVLKASKECTGSAAMLIQLQAGGVGLNLQEYDRIIFMSPWWTSALMDQAIARAVRMGQHEVVKVYHLLLKSEHESALNIDRLMNGKAIEKRKLLQNLFSICARGFDSSEDDVLSMSDIGDDDSENDF